jgi:2-iminoacetate synthase ThiH
LDIAMNAFAEAVDSFPWLASTMLAFEAFEVIRRRLTMFATPGEVADREAQLMVSEKIDAMFEAGANLMAGASAADVVDRYREHVAANAKRLQAI